MAAVNVTPAATEQIAALPLPVQGRVRRILARLEDWPAVSGAKPLQGDLAGHYRKRTGDYRIIFRASDNTHDAIITVVRLAHRKDVYDD